MDERSSGTPGSLTPLQGGNWEKTINIRVRSPAVAGQTSLILAVNSPFITLCFAPSCFPPAASRPHPMRKTEQERISWFKTQIHPFYFEKIQKETMYNLCTNFLYKTVNLSADYI